MNVFVVAYCGYDEFDSPIILITTDIEYAKETAREAFLSGGNFCSNVIIEKWNEKGEYYGIVDYD